MFTRSPVSTPPSPQQCPLSVCNVHSATFKNVDYTSQLHEICDYQNDNKSLRYIIKLEWRFRILPAFGNFSESSAIVDIFGGLFVAGSNGKM